jgi:hypothetical protein
VYETFGAVVTGNTVPFPVNGTWKEQLNGGDVVAQNLRIPNLAVNSHWAKVFYRKG